MRDSLKKAGVTDVKKHIYNVLNAAKAQFQKNIATVSSVNAPLWNPPKTSETDYSQPCNSQALDFTAVGKLVALRFDTIDWNLVNWNLLSVFDKVKIQRKKLIREL